MTNKAGYRYTKFSANRPVPFQAAPTTVFHSISPAGSRSGQFIVQNGEQRSLGPTRSWVDRNAAVFKDVTIHLPSSISRFWASCLCQLRAITKREHRNLAIATHDALLYACMHRVARARPPMNALVTSHDVLADILAQGFPMIVHIVNNM